MSEEIEILRDLLDFTDRAIDEMRSLRLKVGTALRSFEMKAQSAPRAPRGSDPNVDYIDVDAVDEEPEPEPHWDPRMGPGVNLFHLDRVPWNRAPIPPKEHKCVAQTIGKGLVGETIERCACGGMRFDRTSLWIERNTRGEPPRRLPMDSRSGYGYDRD